MLFVLREQLADVLLFLFLRHTDLPCTDRRPFPHHRDCVRYSMSRKRRGKRNKHGCGRGIRGLRTLTTRITTAIFKWGEVASTIFRCTPIATALATATTISRVISLRRASSRWTLPCRHPIFLAETPKKRVMEIYFLNKGA